MRSALIIGASGDIGTAIAEKLAAEGYSLYLHYHAHPVDDLVKQLAAKYPKQDFIPLAYDLTDPEHLDDLVGQLFSLDAVVFAAGQTYYHLFKDTTVEELTALMRVHLLTPMAMLTKLEKKVGPKRPWSNRFHRVGLWWFRFCDGSGILHGERWAVCFCQGLRARSRQFRHYS